MCKALGKLVISKERTILVGALSLPGWFILDECIIHQAPLEFRCLKNGFEWSIYPMPVEWCEMMQNLKRKI